MTSIHFKDPRALLVYDQYLSRVEKMVQGLSPAERCKVLAQVNGQLSEGLALNGEDKELAAITRVTAELGSPEVMLIPYVGARREVAISVEDFHPGRSGMATFRIATAYLAFSMLYSGLALVIAVGVARLFDTGRAGPRLGLGFLGGVGVREVMVNWVILLTGLVSYRLYMAFFAKQHTTIKSTPSNPYAHETK